MCGIAAAGGRKLTATLDDPSFPPPGPYRLEVLETGDTLTVEPATAFLLNLPDDSLWNICLRKAGPEGNFEKCFELRYTESDSIFSATLTGDGVVVAQPETVSVDTAQNVAADSSGGMVSGAVGAEETEAVQLRKVVVRAQRLPKRALGRQTVSAKLIKRLPSLAEADVIRSIQGLPGVVSSSDFSTKIYVRGGGSDQNLFLFDNAPVYSPVHFFGLFSTFLVEGIDEVTFYKSGFPVEYGNRLSSVLDVNSRKGGKDSTNSYFRGSGLKISTVASQAHVEGHEGPLRWLWAGRTTYIKTVVDFLREQGLLNLTLDYYFYDVQGNMAYTVNKDAEATGSLYQGSDRLNFDPFLITWGNTVLPLNYRWKPSREWTAKLSLSYSHFSQNFGLASIFNFYNRIADWRAKPVLIYEGLNDHRLSFGIEAVRTNIVFRNNQYVAKIEFRDETDFWLNSLFAEDKWSPGPWEITPGLRLNYMSRLEEPQVEPRLSVKRSLPQRQSLDFHAGMYYQYINSILFGDQENINEFYYPAKKTRYGQVDPTFSVLFAAGYSRESIFNQYDFSLEGYYKTQENIPVFAPNEKPDSILFNTDRDLGDLFVTAKGYSVGYEVSVRRPAGVLFGGVSYSAGYSVIKEENFPDAYHPKWHQPHSLKADLALNWRGSDGIWPVKRKGRYLRSSSQMKFATGLPYTEYAGYTPAHLLDQNHGRGGGDPSIPEFEDNLQVTRGPYNGAYVPAYFRLDLKPIDWGREGKWNFSFTILNVTNHENVFFYTYDREANPPKRITIPQFPFFPFLLSYEYYF